MPISSRYCLRMCLLLGLCDLKLPNLPSVLERESIGSGEGSELMEWDAVRSRGFKFFDLSFFKANSSILIRLTRSSLRFSCPFFSPSSVAIFASKSDLSKSHFARSRSNRRNSAWRSKTPPSVSALG
eukprot:07980_5